jgi:hypothetical protein
MSCDYEKSTFMLSSRVTCRKHEIQKAVGKKAYSEATRKLQQERKQQEIDLLRVCATRAARRPLVKLGDEKIYARVPKVIGEMNMHRGVNISLR